MLILPPSNRHSYRIHSCFYRGSTEGMRHGQVQQPTQPCGPTCTETRQSVLHLNPTLPGATTGFTICHPLRTSVPAEPLSVSDVPRRDAEVGFSVPDWVVCD
jgi:hypothetical protein